MNRTKLSALILTCMLPLAACSAGTPTADAVSADCTPIVADVTTINEGKLTIQVPEYPPYVSLKGGTLSGVDGVLLTEVAKKLCLTPDAKTASFTALYESVRTGKADMTAGNTYINDERAELYEVSNPVYSDKMALLTTDGASTIESLQGNAVGTPQGYLWVKDLQNALGAENVKLYASEDAVYQDVRAGRIAAGVMTFGGASQAVKANSDTELKVVELEPDPRVQASVGAARTAALTPKGNTKLIEAVNLVIQQMHDDGSLKAALEEVGLPGSAADVATK